MPMIYDWKRFWCPRSGIFDLSDGGFLVDPDSEWGKLSSNSAVPFESIAKLPCLVLLGEPGIGKSKTMELQKPSIETTVAGTGGSCLWIDLGEYQTDLKLCNDVFESDIFASWVEGKHELHLFLDSLDECLMNVRIAARLLLRELKKYPIDRLYLRIFCRTADWPSGLEEGLNKLWGQDRTGVYELAPLRRVDVALASKDNGVDEDSFLGALYDKEAIPFAIKPVTLQFMLNIFKGDCNLPSTQSDLYLKGCKILCTEPNDNRQDGGLGRTTVEERLIAAARIAAVTTFANRYGIWTSHDSGDVPEEDVLIEYLCGGSESAQGSSFHVNEFVISETLAIGLFTSRGPGRMGWAHRTYEEFLSAWYLYSKSLTATQAMSLIVHPSDSQGGIVPQLHHTSAWLASLIPVMFPLIMRTDPEVLLQSDVSAVGAKDREALAATLLTISDDGRFPFYRENGLRYAKLWHSGLAEQLTPYITDSSKGIDTRRLALVIVRECKLSAIQNFVLEVALNPEEEFPVRVAAALTLSKIGSDETKANLKPLALGQAGDDPNDELKGYGLEAVWPAHMTAEELFQCLTLPKDESLLGSYRFFLYNNLPKHLVPGDLPYALKWLEGLDVDCYGLSPLNSLEASIIELAWNNLETPGVLEGFSRLILPRLKHSNQVLEQLWQELNGDDDRRRKIIKALVQILSGAPGNYPWLISYESELLNVKDIYWMIDMLRGSIENDEQRNYVDLIFHMFNPTDSSHMDAIYYACQSNSVIAKKFACFFDPVILCSAEAIEMKQQFARMTAGREKRLLSPSVRGIGSQEIAALADRLGSGDLDAWWHMNFAMGVGEVGPQGRFEPNLTECSYWISADQQSRARILNGAEEYILRQDPMIAQWLGTTTFYRPAAAGYTALLLLLQETPDRLAALGDDIWAKWAPVIVWYPIIGGQLIEKSHRDIINLAYLKAPQEVIDTLSALIDQDNRQDKLVLIHRRVLPCLDERIAVTLVNTLKDGSLTIRNTGAMLNDLLDRGCAQAEEFARSLVSAYLSANEIDRQKGIVAACALINHAPDAGWSVVWPVLEQDQEFGRDVILRVAHGSGGFTAPLATKLSEDELADLFLWLVKQFPYSQDTMPNGVYGPRESISMWKNIVLDHLKRRGTFEAYEAIKGIAAKLPALPWLRNVAFEALMYARQYSWIPPQPADIIKLTSSQEWRLVNNGDQLLDVIIESLQRYEAILQGETPAAFRLWNENPYRPKDEGRLSDDIKIHLAEDLGNRGIVLNREVEIRRGTGDGTGERTDIHVDALLPGKTSEDYKSIKVIIEVKGCWHRELLQAMESQLAGRYLQDNQCQHGLYLVGWYICRRWDDTDYRKSDVPGISISEAQELFNRQASELSERSSTIRALVLNTGIR